MSDNPQAPKRCCCPVPNRYECIEIRYGVGAGYDPEDADLLTDDPCACLCHDECEDEADEH
jgi:hypothetical protein